MLLEGRRELIRALEAGVRVERFFVLEGALGVDAELLARLLEGGGEGLRLGPQAFDRLCYRDRPELPVIAVVKIPSVSLGEFCPRSTGPLVVAEDLEKPGNLGALLRSADGAGAAGVLLVGRCADCGNPNALRASLGTLFTVPLATSESDEALEWLEKKGWRGVAATPRGSVDFHQADYSGKVALLLGSEKDGLSSPWLEAAVQQVVIPMRGVADSLNLAQSATLLLYEAQRTVHRGR
jgi:TrmH family RNA methyltransferase